MRISGGASTPDASATSARQCVEVDVEDFHHPPLVGGQRCRLQVGEQPLDLLDGPLLDQALEGEPPSDESDRGDEHLCVVAAQLGGRRRHGRRAEVDEAEVTVVDDEMLLVELAVHEPVVVQRGEELPELAEPRARLGAGEDRVRGRVDLAGTVDLTEPVGLDQQRATATQHQQGVIGGGGPGGHHGVRRDAGLRCQERHECLVLDLTEAAEADGRAGLAQPDRPPHRRHQRGVVGIAPVQLHDQFAPVGPLSCDREEARVLTVRCPQLGDVDLQIGQRETDIVETGSTGARSDDQVDDRSRAGSRQQRRQYTQRGTRTQCDGSDRTERDDRVAETPGRSDEMG